LRRTFNFSTLGIEPPTLEGSPDAISAATHRLRRRSRAQHPQSAGCQNELELRQHYGHALLGLRQIRRRSSNVQSKAHHRSVLRGARAQRTHVHCRIYPILTEATLDGTLAVKESIKPETGTEFVTISLEGELCALEGLQSVSGKASVLAPTGQDERTLQQYNAINAAEGELKIGGKTALIKGSSLIKLASGESWSFL
jgi:hypothetical protein